MIEEPKIIEGLEVKCDGRIYKNIIFLTIDSYTNKLVHFVSKSSPDIDINVNCDLSDIEIIIKKEK